MANKRRIAFFVALAVALLLGVRVMIVKARKPDLPALVVNARSEDPLDRVETCRELAALRSDAANAVPALIELLDDNRVAKTLPERLWDSISLGGSGIAVNSAASKALVEIGDSSVDPLIGAMADVRPRVRSYAAITLGALADRGIIAARAVPALIHGLQDSDPEVRIWSARALGSLGEKAATDALIACLSDPDPQLRGYAASSLAKINDPKAIQPLIEMLRRAEANSLLAEDALRQMTGLNLGPDAEKWQQWWNTRGGQ